MDLSRIKNLIKGNGDKLIVVENGEPEIVVMSFEEYSQMVNGGGFGLKRADSPAGAVGGAEEETEFVLGEAKDNPESVEMHPEQLRLEDLPL